MNRPLRLAECSQPISWVFCVYFVGERCIIATRQQCCCNAFRIHSQNVRNVFVICTLHIRHTKVWFLRCKSMVFVVQKGGFYIAKVWFLFPEYYVIANRQKCISWLSVNTSRNRCRYFSAHSLHFGKPFVTERQITSNIFPIRLQRNGGPKAAVGRYLQCLRIYSQQYYCNMFVANGGNIS